MKYEISDTIYKDLVQNIRGYFRKANTSIWDRRNKIKVVTFENKEITIKSFKIPHTINKIAYTFFRDSKAKKSYYNSMRILEFVPKPIAYIEFSNWGLISDSYFVSEKFEYDFTIREVLLDPDYENREKVLESFTHFTYKLHNEGVEHLDFSPGNILIQEVSGEYFFKIVDVNRMHFRMMDNQMRLENFSKLWAKDEDLKFIIEVYVKCIDMDLEKAWEIAHKASQKHKDRKNFKKRLKGKPIVD